MKYLKTPKIKINNTDYSDTLKDKVLSIGESLGSIPIITLPNKTINVQVRSPKYTTGIGYCNGDDILFGKKYQNNSIVLSDIQDNSGYWDIIEGQLYFKNSIVNTDEDWKQLCNNYGNQEYSNWDENHVIYAIKDKDLYRCYQLKIVTPQPPVVTERQLYAWTFNITTVYTLTLNIQYDTPVYSWDGETLTSIGLVYNYDVSGDDVTDIYLATNTDNYSRDVNSDQIQIITTPQPDIITYEPRMDQVETEYKFTFIAGSVWKGSKEFQALAITTNKELVSITRDGVISHVLNNIEYLSDNESEGETPIYKNSLAFGTDNKLYKIAQTAEETGSTINITELATYDKKCFVKFQDKSYKNGYFPINYPLVIVDGNLYAKDTLISNTGSWTSVSTGYECGYGIDDGKLYRIYGTNSQWYNKKPTSNDITLVNDTMDWIYVYCNYSSAIAVTSTGKYYNVRNTTISLNKNINVGDWAIHSISHNETINVQDLDQTKNITIPLELLNDLQM